MVPCPEAHSLRPDATGGAGIAAHTCLPDRPPAKEPSDAFSSLLTYIDQRYKKLRGRIANVITAVKSQKRIWRQFAIKDLFHICGQSLAILQCPGDCVSKTLAVEAQAQL